MYWLDLVDSNSIGEIQFAFDRVCMATIFNWVQSKARLLAGIQSGPYIRIMKSRSRAYDLLSA